VGRLLAEPNRAVSVLDVERESDALALLPDGHDDARFRASGAMRE
jgi:hypothetical protein